MNKEKISSQEIIDLVASKASVSKRAAEEFLKVMISSVEEGLLAGEVVKIKNFGTFKLQWNEPRKSVNIQTGEEIMIIGYYKVVFIPDTALKEQVNEPFAHLEPVVLETKKNELIEENEVLSDPLRIFTEQAFEIKNLISEIQALSVNPTTAISEDNMAQEKLIEAKKIEDTVTISNKNESQEELIDQEKLEETDENANPLTDENEDATLSLIVEEKPIINENVKDISKKETENIIHDKPISSEIIVPQLISDLPSTPYLDNVTPIKKRKVWIFVIITSLLIIGLGIGFYFFYAPKAEFKAKYSVHEMSQNFSISEIINTISNWFTPAAKPAPVAVKVVIPKDTTEYDSISSRKPIDSLTVLFENPREYKNFIATERIKAGSRLTVMSKKYFGNKEFWVYIYEANKEQIPNPDNIAKGTIIRIPKLDPRLIDLKNPRCLEKARELHDIYIK